MYTWKLMKMFFMTFRWLRMETKFATRGTSGSASSCSCRRCSATCPTISGSRGREASSTWFLRDSTRSTLRSPLTWTGRKTCWSNISRGQFIITTRMSSSSSSASSSTSWTFWFRWGLDDHLLCSVKGEVYRSSTSTKQWLLLSCQFTHSLWTF